VYLSIKSHIQLLFKHNLFNNFFNLLLLQGINYIMPLVTFPYLVRVLGVNNYGLLSFALAVSSYFILITDYGFNLSATRQVSIFRGNPDKINEIFGSVYVIKLILMTICFVAMSFLISVIDKFKEVQDLLYLSFGMVLGQVLFPIWLFQGLEKMKYVTFLSVAAKVFFTLGIFIFVKGESDMWLVPLFNSLGVILIGILSLYIVNRKFGINFYIPKYNFVSYYIKDGWSIFSSNLAILGYKNNSILILAFLLDPFHFGFYSIGRKIFEAINGLNVVLSQAFFPSISKQQSEIESGISSNLVTLFKLSLVFSLSIFIGTFLFADFISYISAGYIEPIIVDILQLLAVALFIIGVNVPAVQYLLATDNSNMFSIIVWIGVILDLVLLWFFVPLYGYKGALYATLISEFAITGLLYYKSYKVFKSI
jgi:polysaccharide transporter, PST family